MTVIDAMLLWCRLPQCTYCTQCSDRFRTVHWNVCEW